MAGSVRKGSVRKTATKKVASKRKTSTARKSSTRKNGNLTWVGFIKKFQKDHENMSYGEAMAACKKPWAAYKKERGIE